MIGIQLENDSEFLETFVETSISLKLENPIFFDPEKISPGSYSLPFDLPGSDESPKNSEKLLHPDVIENNQVFVARKASIFFDGVPFKKGNINLQEIVDERLRTFFTFGLNSISDSFKKAKLRDVLSQNVVINSDPVVRRIHTNSQQISIIVNGIDYTKSNWYYEYLPAGAIFTQKAFPNGPTTEWSPFIQQVNTNSPGNRIVGTHWLVSLVKFELLDTPLGPQLFPVDCTDPNVPFNVEIQQAPTIPFIIQPEIDGYYDGFISWLQPFLTDTIPVAAPLHYLRFPTIAAVKLNDHRDGVLINHSDGAGNIIVNTPEQRYFNGIPVPENINSIQPFVTLRGVLAKIASFFSFDWEGDFWDDARLDYTLLWNTTSLDLPQQYVNGQYFNFWRRSFNINELVPDITVVEFLKLLQSESSFNLAIYYNEVSKKVRLKYRENIAKAIPYNDITAKASPIKSISPISIAESNGIANLVATFKNINLTVLNLAIDAVNTIVKNETSNGARNGSIEVATKRDLILYDFSIDQGASWQSSNKFIGLTTGIYVITAREVANPALTNEFPFAVNHGPTTFDFTTVTTGESAAGARNGTITVSTSDSWVIHDFSKNGGVTWQPVFNFDQLAAGTYYVAVRNASGHNAIVRVVTVEKNFSAPDGQTSIPQFDFKQGDSFDLQLLKYEGLRTLDHYAFPNVSLYVFPSSPIWKKMAERMLSVKIDLSLNLVDVLNIDWEIKRRFDRTNYLYKSLDMQLTNSGVKVTQVELYTLR